NVNAGPGSPCKRGRAVVWLAIGVVLGAVLPGAAWVFWPRGETAPATNPGQQSAREGDKVAADDARPQLAVLLMTGLQLPPPGGGVGTAAAADEAGAEFWKAAKAARSGDFKSAIESLDKAKSIHAQRRFARLKQAQNPDSDPLEEIFLRTCD